MVMAAGSDRRHWDAAGSGPMSIIAIMIPIAISLGDPSAR